ncbi:hypothetical protein F5884DRAFT_881178, partial [Xylogone sp. PMI_703]
MATELWKHPNPTATNINAFRQYLNRKHSTNLATYNEMHKWSVTETEAFAAAVWEFCGIKYHVSPKAVANGLERVYPPPEWFPGATMNYTENMLCTGLSLRPDGTAVTALSEDGKVTNWTFKQLEQSAAIWANALRSMNVGVGDRVACVLTNSIECLILLLAAGSVGAIFSSTSPDMGAQGIAERFKQLRPKVFFCETEVTYNGKKVNLQKRLQEANEILEETVPELQQTVVIKGELISGRNIKRIDDILSSHDTIVRYEQLPFDHPIYILYSYVHPSDIKWCTEDNTNHHFSRLIRMCICHAAGRALLQQKKELMLHSDLGPNSTYYQYTTTGWMMWNYLVSGLSLGSRIVLYDGSPLYPNPQSQLDIIKKQNVTMWGTSPKFLSALRQFGLPQDMGVDGLQYVMSAGAPLTPELYHWFYAHFPKRIALLSGSGGTDLVGGIVMGNPLVSVYSGEIAGPALGMKVEIWDESGVNIEDSGEKGDLVITKPFFSMPIGFWGPDGQEKYRLAYFDKFPGVWYHGDFIKKNPVTGGYEILGRSDGVLNPGGIRFGTAELYGVLDHITDIEDCIAVGQKIPNIQDENVLLFVKLKDNGRLSTQLHDAIKAKIQNALSPRHVPKHVYQVPDIPYTVNGKKMENLVRDIVSGKPSKASGTAANPECLEFYYRF